MKVVPLAFPLPSTFSIGIVFYLSTRLKKVNAYTNISTFKNQDITHVPVLPT